MNDDSDSKNTCGQGFPADSRYSKGNQLCPSSSRHISRLVWSRIYTDLALNRQETVGISVQFHIQVHRWCFVHKQLPENYLDQMSRWTWDQRHDREHHFCLLPGFTSVHREGRSTLYFHFWQTWRFQFRYYKCSVPEKQYTSYARLWRLYLAACTIYPGLLLVCLFILRATRPAFRAVIRQGTLEIVIEEVLWSIRGSYQIIRSSYLKKWHSVARPNTMTNIHRSDFIPIRDLFTELDLLPIFERFQ